MDSLVKSEKGIALPSSKYRIVQNILDSDSVNSDFDLNSFIDSRLNHNVFVSGLSGSGKSYLLSYLIRTSESKKNFIFNFKPHDIYLSLDLDNSLVIDISTSYIDPFSDFNSFLNAYLLAFKIDVSGIMSSSIPSVLYEYFSLYDGKMTLKHLNKLFLERYGKNDVLGSTARVVASNISLLFHDFHFSFPFTSFSDYKYIIFDFSHLNEIQKTFFLELSLHLVWNYIYGSDFSVSLFLDEVSRLLFLDISVFNDIVRQIRAFGSLFVSSQNLSDVSSLILNQFDTILSFKTSIQSDFDLVEPFYYNSTFPLSVRSLFYYLPDHCFYILQNWLIGDLNAFYYQVQE